MKTKSNQVVKVIKIIWSLTALLCTPLTTWKEHAKCKYRKQTLTVSSVTYRKCPLPLAPPHDLHDDIHMWDIPLLLHTYIFYLFDQIYRAPDLTDDHTYCACPGVAIPMEQPPWALAPLSVALRILPSLQSKLMKRTMSFRYCSWNLG